jgi:hypothetical protein
MAERSSSEPEGAVGIQPSPRRGPAPGHSVRGGWCGERCDSINQAANAETGSSPIVTQPDGIRPSRLLHPVGKANARRLSQWATRRADADARGVAPATSCGLAPGRRWRPARAR